MSTLNSVLLPGAIGNVTLNIAAQTVPALSCTTPTTFSMANLTTTSLVWSNWTALPTGIVGGDVPRALELKVAPLSAGVASYEVCNNTASSVSAGAISFIVGAK